MKKLKLSVDARIARDVMGWHAARPIDDHGAWKNPTRKGNTVYPFFVGNKIVRVCPDDRAAFHLFAPSTDFADAYMVVRVIIDSGWGISIEHLPGKGVIVGLIRPEHISEHGHSVWQDYTGEPLPRLLCEAALDWAREQRKGK